MGKPSKPTMKKISAFLREESIPKIKSAAKAAGVSMTEYVSDSVEQRLKGARVKK